MDREKQLDKAEALFKELQDGFRNGREQRSDAYKRGVMAGLIWKATDNTPPMEYPYKTATAERDAFYAGAAEGRAIWDAAHQAGRVGEGEKP